jgi:hypothetical protein
VVKALSSSPNTAKKKDMMVLICILSIQEAEQEDQEFIQGQRHGSATWEAEIGRITVLDKVVHACHK